MSGLIRDTLHIIFSFLSESERVLSRIVCKLWSESIEQLCEKGYVENLVSSGKFISAVKLMLGNKMDRKGFPLHPTKVMNAACKIGHYGIIKLVFQLFPTIRINNANSLDLLVEAPWTNSIGRAVLLFLQHGKSSSREIINFRFAAECNCYELAEYLRDNTKRTLSSPQCSTAMIAAARYKNTQMAQLILSRTTLPRDCDFTYSVFEIILNYSVEVAELCTQYLSSENCASVSDLLESESAEEKYPGAKDKILPLVLARAEKFREAREKHRKKIAALDEILKVVKSSITRNIREKYGEKPEVQFALSRRDVEGINWVEPWAYSFDTNLPVSYSLETVLNQEHLLQSFAPEIVAELEKFQIVLTVTKVYNTKEPLPPKGTTNDCAIM